MSLTFTDFEDSFVLPRKSFEADVPEDKANEVVTFTIKFGQFIFDLYYGCNTPPTTPIAHARWDKRRLQMVDALKGDFTLPEDFASTLFDQLSQEELWKKCQVFPMATYVDGSEKSITMNHHGVGLFEKSLKLLSESLIEHFDISKADK